jgi:hypothetical protein
MKWQLCDSLSSARTIRNAATIKHFFMLKLMVIQKSFASQYLLEKKVCYCFETGYVGSFTCVIPQNLDFAFSEAIIFLEHWTIELVCCVLKLITFAPTKSNFFVLLEHAIFFKKNLSNLWIWWQIIDLYLLY